jgi:hypothetical protein
MRATASVDYIKQINLLLFLEISRLWLNGDITCIKAPSIVKLFFQSILFLPISKKMRKNRQEFLVLVCTCALPVLQATSLKKLVMVTAVTV